MPKTPTPQMIEEWKYGLSRDDDHSYTVYIYAKFLLEFYMMKVKALSNPDDDSFGDEMELYIEVNDDNTFGIKHHVPEWWCEVVDFEPNGYLIEWLNLKPEWVDSVELNG